MQWNAFVLSFLRKFRNLFSRAPHFRNNRINYRSPMKMLKCAFFHAQIWIVLRLPKRLSSQCFNCFEFWTKERCASIHQTMTSIFSPFFFEFVLLSFITFIQGECMCNACKSIKDLLMQVPRKSIYFKNRKYGSSFNQKFDKTMRHNETNK